MDEYVDEFLLGRISENIEDANSKFILRLLLTDFSDPDFENHGFVVTNLFHVTMLVAVAFSTFETLPISEKPSFESFELTTLAFPFPTEYF